MEKTDKFPTAFLYIIENLEFDKKSWSKGNKTLVNNLLNFGEMISGNSNK